MASDDTELRPCFVICPIGAEGSRIRLESDDLLTHLIKPIALQNGFSAYRNTDIQRPGEITTKIIEDIDRSEIIICDITHHNPNVMYELAVAHAWGKPCIILRRDDLPLPFDISTQNVISFKLDSMAAPENAKITLDAHFKSFLRGDAIFENILTRYQDRKFIQKHGTPQEKKIIDIEEELGTIRTRIDAIERKNRKVFLGTSAADEIKKYAVVINGISSDSVKIESGPDEDFLN